MERIEKIISPSSIKQKSDIDCPRKFQDGGEMFLVNYCNEKNICCQVPVNEIYNPYLFLLSEPFLIRAGHFYHVAGL